MPEALVPPRIFLLEDDPILGQGLRTCLELEGYEVEWQQGFQAAQGCLDNHAYDVYLLDVMLPDGNGIRLCQRLRDGDERAPIFFLTARTDENSVVEGFEAGANDYLRKPFSNRELLARIQASLRWHRPVDPPLERFAAPAPLRDLDGLSLNPATREASWQGTLLPLNRRQFDVLHCLMRHADQVLSREQIMNQIGCDLDVTDRTIDAHISQLRQLLRQHGVEALRIQSVYGLGYRLQRQAP
ncbi:MAG: response regulator transcription factor [Candidatus Sericytochromatia bacterium]